MDKDAIINDTEQRLKSSKENIDKLIEDKKALLAELEDPTKSYSAKVNAFQNLKVIGDRISSLIDNVLILEAEAFGALSAGNTEDTSSQGDENLQNLKAQFDAIEALRDEAKIDKQLWKSLINKEVNDLHTYGYVR